MKCVLIVSMGLIVALCHAAESSIQKDDTCVKPITLICSKPTLVYDPHHVDLLRMDPTKQSMIAHVRFDLPCIWAMVHCKSSSASSGIRRKMRNADEIHTRVEAYNEKHPKHPIVRDPHYYLVWQNADGALKGWFLGREKDALSKEPMYSDLRCMLTEPKLPVRALATLRQYTEGNLYNEAVNWYRLFMHGDDLAANDPGMDWSRALCNVGELCFHNGEYTKAIEMGKQALYKFNHDEVIVLDILGLLCRAHVALQHWDEAINLACDLNPQSAWRGKRDAGVLKALAEAYEHKESLEEAFYTCAQVIRQNPIGWLGSSEVTVNDQYIPAFIHLMYYYAVQKNVLRALSPTLKDRIKVTATAIKRIPEMADFKILQEIVQAYQLCYPGRYEIALQEANRILGEQGASGQDQNPKEFAIVAPEATGVSAPASSAE
jgi:tetratricopeptide (TPR) repeat protein